MKSKNSGFILSVVFILVLISISCGFLSDPTPTLVPTKALPEPGYWITIPEDFGQISFLVNDDSTMVTEIKFIISDWSCGDRKPGGYTGAEEQYPINEGKFMITMNILPSGENIFNSLNKNGILTFTGSFDGASRASGSWEFDFSATEGEKCTGTWSAER